MNRASAVVRATAALSTCVILLGCTPAVKEPDNPHWRDDAVAAVTGTPGLTVTDRIRVNDIDPGFAPANPVLLGAVRFTADPEATLKVLVERVCAVVGPDSSNIGWRLRFSGNGDKRRLSDYGLSASLSEVCRDQ